MAPRSRRAGGVAVWSSRERGAYRAARAWGQAPPPPGGDHEREGGVPAPQAEAGLGLRGPVAGPGGAGGSPGAGPTAPADRGVRRVEHRSHRHGRLDGGVRGWPAEAGRLPTLRDQGRARTGRLRLDIPAVGLAKRLEEVYVPGQPEPLRIERGAEALFVLQHVRDEAHRFAVEYHRKLRERRAMASPLDDVPGIGPARKKALLRRFGSLARLARASEEEIAATPGVGPRLAAEVTDRLHRPSEAASA